MASLDISPTSTVVDLTASSEANTKPKELVSASSTGFEFESPKPRVVTWDGPNDPENPRNWSYGYKWFITCICSVLTLNVYVSFPQFLCSRVLTSRISSTFASSAPCSLTHIIAGQLGSSTEASYLIISTFLLGYVFGPMFWGPGSELVGRRPILVVTMALYTLCHLGQALAQNMQTIIITRFFAGFFACAPLTNSGGIIADMWDPSTSGIATSVFTANVFLGTALGPVVGSL